MRHRFAALLLALLIIGTSATDTVSAVAVDDNFYDENFYSLNQIGLYDPRCGNTTSAEYVQLAGKDNTEKILNFFMRKGLSLAQSAGIVGNMIQESGLNPAIREGGRIVDNSYTLEPNVGFGLVQWTSPGRQQNFTKSMKDLGVGVTDLSGQLEFVWKEMNDSYSGMLRALRTTNDPVVAAVIVHGKSTTGSSNEKYQAGVRALGNASGYESSGDNGDKVVRVRGGAAEDTHRKYADAPALAGSTADKSMTPAGEGSEADASTMVTAKNDPKKKDCIASSGSAAGTGFAELVTAYAWSSFIQPGTSVSTLADAQGKSVKATDQKPAYTAAVTKAVSSSPKRYVGGSNGNDCGGFVTTLVYDSGHDKSYNTNATGGNTLSQEAWLKKNWVRLNDIKQGMEDTPEREAGDVAINEDHTYIYVGKIDNFNSTIASASWSDRAPMAGKEGVKDSTFRWYRKK